MKHEPPINPLTDITVGPVGNGAYAYKINGRVSVYRYANAASAWHNAKRPQVVREDGYLEPDHWAESREGRMTAEEKLEAIREIFRHFDWEFHDRQLALEAIERIVDS